MRHNDGTELSVGGVNLAVAIMIITTVLLLGLFLNVQKSSDGPADTGGEAQ